MKKRAYLTLILALTCGSLLMLNGCGKNGIDKKPATSISVEEEAEAEVYEGVVDGTLTLYVRWYAVDGNRLVGANVSCYDGADMIFSGITNETGYTDAINVPANKELTFVVTDSTGATLAQTPVTFNMDTQFDSMTVVPSHVVEEDDVYALSCNINPSKTKMTASIFMTADQNIAIGNLYPYVEGSEIEAAPAEGDIEPVEDGEAPAEGEGEGEAAPAEGEAPTE